MMTFLRVVSTILIVSACGTAHENVAEKNATEISNQTTTPSNVLLSLNVGYDNVRPGLFSLADASSFTVDVTGCTSGFAIAGHDSSVSGTSFNMYKGDRECAVVLKSFVWDLKTWTMVGGGGYSGTTAVTFENTSDNKTLSVSSPENLPSPLTNNLTVAFHFSEIEAGTARQIISVSSPTFRDATPFDAPNYKLKPTTGVVLTNVTSVTNIATFLFHLECNQTLETADTVCPTASAQSQLQTDMRAALVKDTFSGVLTHLEAQTALAGASGASYVAVTSGHFDAPSSGFNGGFSVSLDTSEDLTTTKKMILILEHTRVLDAEKTYTYMTVDFASGTSLFFLPLFLQR